MDIILREWRLSDAEDIYLLANNKKIADNLRDSFPFPYTYDDAVNYIRLCIENEGKGQCCRAIEVDGKAVGSIGIFLMKDVYRKSAEVGYWLGEPYWGRGITTNALLQICEYAFNKFDIVRIFAECYAYNKGSRRALEKAGFVLEGIKRKSIYKNGKIYDSCMYALVR